MSKYKLNKKIHSCTVDKELLINLEDCILNRIIDKVIGEYLNEEMIEKYKNNYTISIKEKDGLEEFKRIEDYKGPLLPKDTNQVKLDVNLITPDIPENNIGLSYISIKIGFNIFYEDGIEINIQSENQSKQIASNIYDLIKETIEHKYNGNYVYHLFRTFDFSGFGIALLSAGVGAYFTLLISLQFSSFTYSSLITFSNYLFFLFYLISSKLKPYIVFESTKSKKYKKRYNDIKTLVIFTIIGSIIVKLIFSYIFN